jgi:hypothetical protein
MNGKDIQKYLKPRLEEMFDGYVLLGFRANSGKPLVIGHAPHELLKPKESATIKESTLELHRIVKNNEKNAKD